MNPIVDIVIVSLGEYPEPYVVTVIDCIFVISVITTSTIAPEPEPPEPSDTCRLVDLPVGNSVVIIFVISNVEVVSVPLRRAACVAVIVSITIVFPFESVIVISSSVV